MTLTGAADQADKRAKIASAGAALKEGVMSRVIGGLLRRSHLGRRFRLDALCELADVRRLKDISKFNRDVLDAARKQREKKPE
jgi:hypothetical protein